MAKVTDLPEVDAIVDADYFYVWDVSSSSAPDKKVPASKMRPSGSKITNYFRFDGTITVPALASGVEGTATIAVAGAAVGDHTVFNLKAINPAGLAILGYTVTAADTVTVLFRNVGAGAYAGASLACTALVTRSQ